MASHDNFTDFWEEDEYADVVFLVGEESNTWRFAAHKMILSMKNSIFQDLFYESKKQSFNKSKTTMSVILEKSPGKNDEFRIESLRPEIFHLLLRFLYTGKLEIGSLNSAVLLLDIGHKFNVKEIILAAVQYLTTNVTTKNLLEIYICIENYLEEEETVPLHAVLAAGIDSKADDIINTNAFTSLTPQSLNEIISRDTLQVSSEFILFKALLRWSTAECKRKHLVVNNKNRRLVLGDILLNVRFKFMSDDEFSQICKVEESLTEEDKTRSPALPRIKNPFLSSCLILPLDLEDCNKYHDFCESFFCKSKMILKAVAILRSVLHPLNDIITIIILKNNENIFQINKKEFSTKSYSEKGKLVYDLMKPVCVEANDNISLRIRCVPNKIIKKYMTYFKLQKYFKRNYYTMMKWRKSFLCLYSLTQFLGWDQIVELQFLPIIETTSKQDILLKKISYWISH